MLSKHSLLGVKAMAEIDLTSLDDSDMVLHFGGRPNEVDAFTFSNSLLAFSEALREINTQINPQYKLEITIEGLGKGSFRAKISTEFRTVLSLLAADARGVIIGVLGNIVFTMMTAQSEKPQVVTMDENQVVVSHGDDKVIMKRSVWDATSSLKNSAAVKKHISKAFEVMAADPFVTGFGIAHRMHVNEPVGLISREKFSEIASIEHLA